jgi:hypothetical protein
MLEVIGAGFGRTGTHSLGLALEKLGFGPWYNTFEVFKNPGHQDIWRRALEGKRVDWDDIFSDYKSAVEWPTVTFFDQIVQQYPHARVILTIRDPESWYESACDTIFEVGELNAHHPEPAKRKGLYHYIFDHTFSGRFWEKEHVLEVYRKHIEHVTAVVPKERLLHFDIRDGWNPLCDFLQKAVPDERFPKLNKRKEFIDSAPDWAKKIRKARRQKKVV